MTAEPTLAETPFSDAIGVEPLGDGRYRAELGPTWTVVGGRVHGGLLQVLLTRAALARLEDERPGTALDPLVVSTDFLHAPELGTVELHTELLKVGRTVSVVSVRLVQADRVTLASTVTAGRLPDEPAEWAQLPAMPAVPPPEAIDLTQHRAAFPLAGACQLRCDPGTLGFARGERGAPEIRGWVRPHGEEPDLLFALLAGDVMPPTVLNLRGRLGWAPTVQMTALLRSRPAPGWLRLYARSTNVAGTWFDEDMVVVDQSGRLVCQTRQLALAPRSC